MKKILLLSALLIFACSGDDSNDYNNTNSGEPIIGLWTYYYAEYFDYSLNSWFVNESDPQDGHLIFSFYVNGDYHIDYGGGEICIGSWQNLGNNIYRLTDSECSVDGVVYDDQETVSDERILFYCNNNIMRLDFGWAEQQNPDDYPNPENGQQYMYKQNYNYADCNEVPYNIN